MRQSLKKAPHAVYAGLVAGLSALGALLIDNTSLSDVTAGQWVWVVLAALVAGGGVYGLTNGRAAKAGAS